VIKIALLVSVTSALPSFIMVVRMRKGGTGVVAVASKGRSGRTPTLFVDNPGLADLLADLLSAGHSFYSACRLVGVSYQTFRRWMHFGGDPLQATERIVDPETAEEPYRSFATRMREAEREGAQYRKTIYRDRAPKGRKPKDLDLVQRVTLLEWTKAGYPWAAASREAGVSLTTLVSWLRLGGHPATAPFRKPLPEEQIEEPYRSFVREFMEAEQIARDRDAIPAA
jgi:hypothetical protein